MVPKIMCQRMTSVSASLAGLIVNIVYTHDRSIVASDIEWLTWVSAQFEVVLPEAAQVLALTAPSQQSTTPAHLLQGPLTARRG